MFTHTRTVRIEWGDCDPAGIVFYPNYFSMFDHSSVMLLEAALGMTKHALYKSYDFHGYPIVETRARFLIPTRYCDDVTIETAVTAVRRELSPDASPSQRWCARSRRV
jgi:4-hydroxybenzoyl-CoA thioesterase